MEVASSAAVGALRAGIQVVTNLKGPMLEFYFELHNDFGPETTTHSQIAGTHSHRSQRIFVAFWLVNIGSVRAENLMLAMTGEYQRKRPLAPRFGTEISQVAPGQMIYLFKLGQHELFPGSDEKHCKFELSAEYNGPWRGFNRILRIGSHVRGVKQFTSRFLFNSAVVSGDLPPANYA